MTRFAILCTVACLYAFVTSPLLAEEPKGEPPAAAKSCGITECSDLLASILKNIQKPSTPDGKPLENVKIPDLKSLLGELPKK